MRLLMLFVALLQIMAAKECVFTLASSSVGHSNPAKTTPAGNGTSVPKMVDSGSNASMSAQDGKENRPDHDTETDRGLPSSSHLRAEESHQVHRSHNATSEESSNSTDALLSGQPERLRASRKKRRKRRSYFQSMADSALNSSQSSLQFMKNSAVESLVWCQSWLLLPYTALQPMVVNQATLLWSHLSTEAGPRRESDPPDKALMPVSFSAKQLGASCLLTAIVTYLFQRFFRPRAKAESCYWLNMWWRTHVPQIGFGKLREVLLRQLNKHLRAFTGSTYATCQVGSTLPGAGRLRTLESHPCVVE